MAARDEESQKVMAAAMRYVKSGDHSELEIFSVSILQEIKGAWLDILAVLRPTLGPTIQRLSARLKRHSPLNTSAFRVRFASESRLS